MQNLPWFPRPLIIFAMICGRATPCVQWHGQDWQGKITEEQMLFPICGRGSELIECVRPEYWMVSFLGCISVWNKMHPEHQFVSVAEGEVKRQSDISIIRIIANELFAHETVSLICPIIRLGEGGVLYSPQTYENPNAQDELPWHGLDHDLQSQWRKAYLNEDITDISHAVESQLARLHWYPDCYLSRYHAYLRERDRENWLAVNGFA